MHSLTDSNETPLTPPLSAAALTPAAVVNKPLAIRIIGLGGAGANAVAHMAASDLRQLRLVACHTNSRILESTPVPEKILLGAQSTCGMGTGGDPSLGRTAAEQDLALLRDLCEQVDLLFIVLGLGGGTGTGVAPVLARVAKECGALVVAVAALPFDLEGTRRGRQARQGLEELKAAADAVICLPNQKMFQVVDGKTSVLDSLKFTNELLAQGIRGIWQMLTRPSLIHVDFADLRAVLRDRHVESCFASVEARGEGRAREIIELLLASPLLDGGQALSDAEAVLVNLVGGPELSMADVQRIMDEINRRTDNAEVIVGASIAEGFAGRVGLTLVASRRSHPDSPEHLASDRFAHLAALPEGEHRFFAPAPGQCGASRFLPPVPPANLDTSDQGEGRLGSGAGAPGKPSGRRLQQGYFPLPSNSKGRFEKTPPTIHRGEDLDVPTYVRRGTPLN